MSFQIRLDAGDLRNLRFAVSPLWEVQEAVRTLRRAGRQGCRVPWLRRVRHAAAGLDLEPLWLLMPGPGHTPGFFLPSPSGLCTRFEDELERLRSADPALAAAEMARSLDATPGAAAGGRGRAMLDNPGRAVKELADLLELAWKALVAPDWPRLRALLEADADFHARRLADGGPGRLFDGLHPGMSWTAATSALAVEDGAPDSPGPAGRAGLLLVPSVFGGPDLVCGDWPGSGPGGGPGAPRRRVVVYPARGLEGLWARPGGQPPPALARLLGRGRAAVLAGLAEPAGTTELAGRLGLAPSSVSAHLTALRDAGLLTSRRQGHQVLYERTPLGIALTAPGDAGSVRR